MLMKGGGGGEDRLGGVSTVRSGCDDVLGGTSTYSALSNWSVAMLVVQRGDH